MIEFMFPLYHNGQVNKIITVNHKQIKVSSSRGAL